MTLRHAPQLRSTSLAFSLSLLVHLMAGLLLSVQTIPPPAPVINQPAPSTPIPLLSEKELKRLRSFKRPEANKPKKPTEEKSAQKRRQVVEIPPPPVERIPTESRFLAEYNSAVKEEVVHRSRRAPQAEIKKSERRSISTGRDKNGSRKGKRHLKTNTKKRTNTKKSAQKAPKKGRQKKRATTKTEKQVSSQRKYLKRGEGPFKSQLERSERNAEQNFGAHQGTKSGQGTHRLTPTHYQSLLPTLGPQNQSRIDGSLDHIEEVKRGDQTALNTREYRYAFFFNRVKRDVSAQWKPAHQLGRIDPRGQVYGVRDRKTILAVTLKPDGSIVKIDINTPSGVPLLDREAISAFLKAQPFHNPPSGLVEKDGLIRFKFGFYIEIGSRSFKLFR